MLHINYVSFVIDKILVKCWSKENSNASLQKVSKLKTTKVMSHHASRKLCPKLQLFYTSSMLVCFPNWFVCMKCCQWSFVARPHCSSPCLCMYLIRRWSFTNVVYAGDLFHMRGAPLNGAPQVFNDRNCQSCFEYHNSKLHGSSPWFDARPDEYTFPNP